MSPAKKRSPTPPARGSTKRPEGPHTCVRCPVCASETCRILQELGMYCETQCAASLAQASSRSAAAKNAAA